MLGVGFGLGLGLGLVLSLGLVPPLLYIYIYIYIYISYIKCNNVTLYERILTCFIIYRNAILTFLTHPLLTHLPPPPPWSWSWSRWEGRREK